MPYQIVIVFVAELKVYGFRGSEGVITELLCILEKVFATGSGIARGEARIMAMDWWRRKKALTRGFEDPSDAKADVGREAMFSYAVGGEFFWGSRAW